MRPAIWQILQKKPAVSIVNASGVLDGVTGVRAAYGLRTLFSNYSGALIQLSNGTTTIDVGAVNGVIDTAAELSLGANSWVTRLYDQSGNGNHAIARGGAAARNFRVRSGVPVTTNGKPSILTQVSGQDGFLMPLGIVSGVTTASCAVVYRQPTGSDAAAVIIANAGEDLCASPYDGRAYEAFMASIRQPPGGFTMIQNHQALQMWKQHDASSGGAGLSVYRNQTLLGVTGQSAVINPSLRILASNFYGALELSEFFMLDRILPTADRIRISNDTSTYYNLTP